MLCVILVNNEAEKKIAVFNKQHREHSWILLLLFSALLCLVVIIFVSCLNFLVSDVNFLF